MAGLSEVVTWLRSLWRPVEAYAAHPDPLTEVANWVALVVASNQPFFPLYIWWVVGDGVAPSFLTFLSTPFFLAVPALARRNSLAGRALLPLTGMANTVLSAKAFGEASGVVLFLAPCVILAAMLFRRNERIVMLALVGIGFAIFAGLGGRYGAPLHLYTADEYARFLRLNAFSVGSLTVLIGLQFSGALAAIEERAGRRGP